MLKCPVCKKSARIDSIGYKFYIKCGCQYTPMVGENKSDLKASWNRWVRMVRKMR